MFKVNETTYEAQKGCFVVRTSDDKIMGTKIELDESDSIDNYKEVEYLEAIRAIVAKMKKKG